MTGYHATTPKKLARYQSTGAILPAVRFWSTEYKARKWMIRTGRTVLLRIQSGVRTWPLPIKGGAFWTDQMIREWEVVT